MRLLFKITHAPLDHVDSGLRRLDADEKITTIPRAKINRQRHARQLKHLAHHATRQHRRKLFDNRFDGLIVHNQNAKLKIKNAKWKTKSELSISLLHFTFLILHFQSRTTMVPER